MKSRKPEHDLLKEVLPLAAALLVTTAVGTPLPARAQSAGTRGGGQIVDVDSTPSLADLVTKSVCRYHSGAEVMAMAPDFEGRFLRATGRLNWYLAASLANEARRPCGLVVPLRLWKPVGSQRNSFKKRPQSILWLPAN